MADRAHSWTDWKISEIEKELDRIYSRAQKELGEKADAYFSKFGDAWKKKQAEVDAGKLSQDDFNKWFQGKVATGEHWFNMERQMAEELLHVNETATAYVNDQLPEVYSRNYNQTANGINGQISGYSFELVDASTVRRLATDDKTLLPYKYVDGKKDVRWNTQKVNSEVLQGILQGDSIPELSKRLENVVGMNKTSAIRNARTSCTSAENKGRMDMINDAEDKGVHVQKGWMATNDDRTRDSHASLSGTYVDSDDLFDNGLEYPGDPNGDASEVYNCRCTLVYKVVAIGDNLVQYPSEEQPEEQAEENLKEPESIHLPDEIFKEKQSTALEEFLDGVDGKDPSVAELYGTIGDVASEKGYGIKVSYTGKEHEVITTKRISTGEITNITVKIPKMEGNLAEKAETTVHEIGHFIDQLYGGNNFVTAESEELKDAVKNGRPMSERIRSLFAGLKADGDKAYDESMQTVRKTNTEYNSRISELFGKHDYSAIRQLQKERDKAWRVGVEEAADAQRAAHKGYGALEDIYDAITGGDLYGHGYYGHGSKYYRSESNRAAETFANYCSLSQVYPEIFDVLKEEQPEICDACGNLVMRMLGK